MAEPIDGMSKCLECDAVFDVVFLLSIDTENGWQYCPFCGCEMEDDKLEGEGE